MGGKFRPEYTGDRQTVVNGVGIDQYVTSWQLMDFDGRLLKSEEVPLARAIMFGETCSREFIIKITGDDNRIVLANAAPIIDDNGKVVAGIMVFMDVTASKQAEEKIKASLLEKETMLKEIHHRVKNNLQVISSLLNIQSYYLQDEKARETLWESMARVRTMSMIHDQLYQSQDLARVDFGLFIRNLISNVHQSYKRATSPVEIKIDTDEIHLGIDTSIPCGLLLNELVSNALKNAFPEGRGGEIHIGMRSEGDLIVLTVQDNGIGLPDSVDFKNTKSLGLELVNILVGQMNGKIDMQVEGGTAWTITFPLKSKREWPNV